MLCLGCPIEIQCSVCLCICSFSEILVGSLAVNKGERQAWRVRWDEKF